MGAQTPDVGKAGARAELFVLSGNDVGRSFEIVHGSNLGRAPDRTVVLRDRSISRHHAHFECIAGAWSIVDDGSTNGFMVDGSRSTRAELTDLREFVIGEVLVRLRTQLQSSSAASVPVRPAPPPRAPADEIVIEDEILLDSDPEATSPTIARSPARTAPIVSAPAPRAASEPELATRGRRVLQYHKEAAHSGLLVTDLAQRPPWMRAIVYAIVVAGALALAWGVYRGVLSMREGAAGSTEAVPEDV